MTRSVSSTPRIRFPEAFLIALVIHLLAFLLGDLSGGFFLGSTSLPEVPPTPEPLRFTFVDLPQEVRVDESPEVADLSDANRKARGETPPEEAGDSPIPFSEGNTSMVEITPPESEATSGERIAEGREPVLEAGKQIGEAGSSPVEVPAPGPEASESQLPGEPGSRERMQRILQALREVSRSKPSGGFDSRFDHRIPTRIREFGGLSFETRDFEWGDYGRRLTEIIRSNWRIPLAAQHGEKGKCSYRFTIERDGTISRIELVASSGIPPLDSAAHQALLASSPLPPLPDRFPGERETVTCIFYYNIPIER